MYIKVIYCSLKFLHSHCFGQLASHQVEEASMGFKLGSFSVSTGGKAPTKRGPVVFGQDSSGIIRRIRLGARLNL